MIANKKVGMNEILLELGATGNNADGIYHFDMKDKFFVGGGCENPWPSSIETKQHATFKNIAICAEPLSAS